MKPALKAALLLVPVLALAALTLLHVYYLRTGTEWRVPITGYDPRDLLAGQYLQFRYQWNIAGAADAATCSGDDCALCATAAAPPPTVSLVPLASAPASCSSFIAGRVPDSGSFVIGGSRAGLTRYYIPESAAPRLQQLLNAAPTTPAPAFSIGLRVAANGRAYIEMLYIDGLPLPDWLGAAAD